MTLRIGDAAQDLRATVRSVFIIVPSLSNGDAKRPLSQAWKEQQPNLRLVTQPVKH